jgi:phosphomannomutase
LAKIGVSSDSGKMKFNTDEWLGMIADELTFPKERKVTRAIVNYLETVYTKQQAVLVVYDTRFIEECSLPAQ